MTALKDELSDVPVSVELLVSFNFHKM